MYKNSEDTGRSVCSIQVDSNSNESDGKVKQEYIKRSIIKRISMLH